MNKKIIIISFFVLFIFLSCSTPLDNPVYNYEDEFVKVNIGIEDDEYKFIDINILNTSDENIILLFAIAKVRDKDGNFNNIIQLDDALSSKKIINILNIELNSNELYQEKYISVGKIKKQIIHDDIIIPWIDKESFYLEIPYLINNQQRNIIIDFN